MAGNTIKMKDLPAGEDLNGFNLVGVDAQGKSKKVSASLLPSKAEVATIGQDVSELNDYLNGSSNDENITGTTVYGFFRTTDQKLFGGTDGASTTSTTYKRTDYIAVQVGKKYAVTGGTGATSNVNIVAAFNSSKTFITDSTANWVGQNSSNGPLSTKEITIPNGVAYIMVCQNVTYNNNVDAIKVIKKGSASTSYIDNKLPNKSTLDKFSEVDGNLLWNNKPIEGGESVSSLVLDLPKSDGSDIESGYAYIDIATNTIKVK